MDQPSKELTEAWETNLRLKAQLETEQARYLSLIQQATDFRLQMKHQVQGLLKVIGG